LQTHAMPSAELASVESGQREKVFDAFRRWGYVRADLDPLGHYVGEEHPELNLTGTMADEARRMGAHHVIDTHSAEELKKAAGSFDFVISTVNADLDWNAYIGALAPKGRLHVVGVAPNPLPVPAFSLLVAQRSVSGSPSGSPAAVARMLEFAARHGVAPVVEEFPMSQANQALAHLEAGKARYRIVLKNDLE